MSVGMSWGVGCDGGEGQHSKYGDSDRDCDHKELHEGEAGSGAREHGDHLLWMIGGLGSGGATYPVTTPPA